jgi:acetyl esterase/lipase
VLLLVVSVVCLVFVLNALRPLRHAVLGIPAFFAAWVVTETAPVLLALAVVGGIAAALLSGPSTVTALGLVVTACVVAGLLRLVLVSEQAEAVADAAVQGWEAVGPGTAHAPSLLRRYFVPMMLQHPDVERLADVPYSDETPRHKLDVYRRKDHPTGCPTLLQVHGGGWVIGDKKQQGRPLMSYLAMQGWVCFAPNYRLSPRATFPDHLVDVKRAIAWVREHGAEYGADPGFLVLTGGSAGGHLVALAALTANDPAYQPGFEDVDTRVQGCVPFYGVYDLHGETGTKAAKVRHERVMTRLVLKTRDPEAFVRASPLAQVRADAPAFLVIHGRNDTLVPVEEARALVAKLRAVSQQPVVYLELPGTEHAFDVFPSIRSDHVVRAVARFLEALRANALTR